MGSELIGVVVSGLSNASVYALLAMGMALIYGVSKVFNLAYGSFFSLAAYLAWVFFSLNLPYPVVLVIVLLIMFALGAAVDVFLFRHIRSDKRIRDMDKIIVMVTLGLVMVFDNLDLAIFGPFLKRLPPLVEGTVSVGGYVLGLQEVAVFAVAVAVIGILVLFLNKTRRGMAIRAVSQDSTGARIVGISHSAVNTYVFAIGTVLAAVGGILLASRYFVSYKIGWDILLKAWVITVFGGMGSLGGAAVAAFVLAMVDSFVFWKLGATVTPIVWVVIMIITFIVRPQGLLGKE